MVLIEELARLIARLITTIVGGKQGALEQFIEFLIFVAIVIVATFVRPIAMRIKIIRRLLDPGERFAGRYVQVIDNDGERRYSILDIHYRSHKHGYFLSGIQYDTDGRRAVDFDSENVAFREGSNTYLEFVWKAETVADHERFDGYTKMNPDNSDNVRHLEGRGFFITFHDKPKRRDLSFMKITKTFLQEFKLEDPISERSRVKFVKDLHAKLKEHPELQPKEEVGKPIL